MRNMQTYYCRLPGKGLRREGFISVSRTWCTLWLADDHLLSVDAHLFSEDYKRFYFKDIQAIVLRKTHRRTVWTIILALFLALWLAIAATQNSLVAGGLWLAVAAVFGVMLTINVLRGPTCACHLITAVHKELLPSLNRLNTAEKVLRTLRRQIENAQRDLSTAGEP